MRILIVTNSDIGLYKFRKELLEELLKQHEVIICLPYGDFVPIMIEMGCKYEQCEFNRHGINPFKEIKQINYYRKLIKRIQPVLVFTYTIKPNIYAGMACASLGARYVANITGLGTAVEDKGILQIITLVLYKYGLRKSQKVFLQNAENRDFLQQHGVIKGEYELLPGSGVNLSQYHVYDYPENEPIKFIFIARVMKEKGIEQYLDAAEYIHKIYPQTQFHICGFCEQDYKEKLEKYTKLGVIQYHGQVNDMSRIYQSSSCIIHPTYYPEGLSNVLLESAACGRPIITTNRSGCREVIDDGVNGYMVNQKDSNDLIEKIEKFLSLTIEERRKMGLAGRRKVEKEFNRQIVVNKYIEIVNSIKEEESL